MRMAKAMKAMKTSPKVKPIRKEPTVVKAPVAPVAPVAVIDNFFERSNLASPVLNLAVQGTPADETARVEGEPLSAMCNMCKLVKLILTAAGENNMVKIGTAKGEKQLFKCRECNRFGSKLTRIKAKNAALHRDFMTLSADEREQFRNDFPHSQRLPWRRKWRSP